MRLFGPVVIALVVLALVVGWFVAFQRNADVAQQPSTAERATVLDATASPDPSPSDGTPLSTIGREEGGDGPSALLRGWVKAEGGRPVEGATVTWHAFLKRDVEDNPAWPGADWGECARPRVSVETDSTGAFVFLEAPPALGLGSALTVLHDEHVAGGMDLPVDAAEWNPGVEIRLEPADPIVVRVVDGEGRAQAGARVRQLPVLRQFEGDPPAQVSTWRRLLSRDCSTSADGTLRLAPFPAGQALLAEKDGRAARPWSGEAVPLVVLELLNSFTIGGTVALPFWDVAKYEGERRILVTGWTGNIQRPLARLRDVAEGAWGPVAVPLDSSQRFTVRLEGAPIAPQEQTFTAPAPSAHRQIDFVAEKLEDLFLFVQDEDGKPITTARAVVHWGDLRSRSTARRLEGASRPDGMLYVGTIPAGHVLWEVTAPGYGRTTGEGDLPSEEFYYVVLPRAGSIRGQCTRAGSPVRDFQVIYWNAGQARVDSVAQFLGREDGTFLIENVGTGTWTLMATDAAHPGGAPVTVDVVADAETQVALELGKTLSGAGRVVDATTGEGVPAARVQLHSSGGLTRSAAWGAPLATALDGTFEADAFVRGNNHVTVEADGYAWLEASLAAGDDEFLDWGDLLLHRPQSLRLELLGSDELSRCRLEELTVHTVENFILPRTHPSSDGSVRFDAVPPGDHRLLITYPDGAWARLQLQLEPGKDWAYDHKIAGDNRIQVAALTRDGAPFLEGGHGLVSAQEQGLLVLRMSRLVDGKFSFEGIRSDRAQVEVLSESYETLAAKTVVFGSSTSVDVEFRIGDEPIRVRVVDPDGEPLATAWVTVRSSDGSEILGLDDTGVDGWAELVGLPPTKLLMDVSHGIAGWRQGVPLDASVDEHEFVLDAKGSLELRFLDGELPLAGVVTQVQTTGGVNLRDPRSSDEQGLATYAAIGEGAYHIRCTRPDCWPVTVDRALGAGEHASQDVQMRRLATLRLVVRDASGLPIANAEVELDSAEFGEKVADWLDAGRVRSEGGLRSDVRGELRVEGLPRGAYRWRVALGEGESSGSIDVAPGEGEPIAILVGG